MSDTQFPPIPLPALVGVLAPLILRVGVRLSLSLDYPNSAVGLSVLRYLPSFPNEGLSKRVSFLMRPSSSISKMPGDGA